MDSTTNNQEASPKLSLKGTIQSIEDKNLIIKIEGTEDIISLPSRAHKSLTQNSSIELQLYTIDKTEKMRIDQSNNAIQTKTSSQEELLRTKLEGIIN